ncbi:MAG: GNAT family N-acetyltransferase [Arthrobacter sp.]|nr:GNAT family N-acetyltransferase [Arthrobacter sp.]
MDPAAGRIVVGCAQAADLPGLLALDPPGSGLSARRLERQAAGEIDFLVAWIDAAPVGACELLLGADPELRSLHVTPSSRGRGAGSALVQAAERAVAPGRLRLAVGLDNPRARALYLRLGYEPTGRLQTDSYDYVDEAGSTRHATETSEWLVKDVPA